MLQLLPLPSDVLDQYNNNTSQYRNNHTANRQNKHCSFVSNNGIGNGNSQICSKNSHEWKPDKRVMKRQIYMDNLIGQTTTNRQIIYRISRSCACVNKRAVFMYVCVNMSVCIYCVYIYCVCVCVCMCACVYVHCVWDRTEREGKTKLILQQYYLGNWTIYSADCDWLVGDLLLLQLPVSSWLVFLKKNKNYS